MSVSIWTCFLLLLLGPLTAFAYRPFVSTDAAIVEKNFSEIEFGLIDWANHRGQDMIAAPELRYNFGLTKRLELVLEGALQVYDSANTRDIKLLGPALSLKGVLIEGPLQDGNLPFSLAVEVGALLPETVPHSGFGFEGALIASFRTGKFTWHVNGGGGVERETLEPIALWGVIVEHPITKEFRIAAEVNGESVRGAPASNSALLGLLWKRSEITYDAGLRFGLTKDAPDIAFTAGLTFKF